MKTMEEVIIDHYLMMDKMNGMVNMKSQPGMRELNFGCRILYLKMIQMAILKKD